MNTIDTMRPLIRRLDHGLEQLQNRNDTRALADALSALSEQLKHDAPDDTDRRPSRDQLRLLTHDIQRMLAKGRGTQALGDVHRLHRNLTCHVGGFPACTEPNL